ncbi:SCO3242 family prenyltransferase [Streptomyces sp. NPDC051219]|uniref:SCO3242 family prenyltransferase n=1 Tax=Streptomyces sp. NPDC051219 TaxID=3155283 RepID=UPI00343492F5
MSSRAWAELLRVSALFTVPGDALAGAAAVGLRPNRGTGFAIGASLCLYEAGMALNDWADRAEDAVDRPHRPIPSGRIRPGAALAAAGGLTLAGLALSSRAGRPALAVATALAATVWSYDLHLKHTAVGPAAMATARSLDLLLGATATMSPPPGGSASRAVARSSRAGRRREARRIPGNNGGRRDGARPSGAARDAMPAAALLGVHTLAVTAVSRHEAHGGSTAVPLAALAATVTLGALVGRRHAALGHGGHGGRAGGAARLAATGLGAVYAGTAARPLLHAALNPSPTLTQRAVGGGIRAMIPLQAALAARTGAVGTGAALMALVPLARKFARKVSPT